MELNAQELKDLQSALFNDDEGKHGDARSERITDLHAKITQAIKNEEAN